MGTKCTCGGGHRTFGACLRAKNISVGYCRSHVDKNPARHDRTANRRHEAELEAYRRARKAGIRPGGTTRAAVDFANEMSDRRGEAFDAANPLKGVELG